MHTLWLRGCLCLILLVIVNISGNAFSQVTSAVDEPRYLTFQLFTAGPGFTTEPNRRAISQLPPAGSLESAAADILNKIGQRGDAGHRLGVVVGPLSMDHSDDQLRMLVKRTFAIASTYNIAVGLHIDESKFWMNRSDLWRNPANVEWVDWNRTPSTGQYLNWGEPWKLAPSPCMKSPAMINEARRIAGQVIGPAIAEQLSLLRNTGNESLFAGVIVGWETAIGQDYETRRAVGYCALTHRGFGASSPPSDPGGELQTVVRDWISTWMQGLAQAGVPSARIYSHIAVTTKTESDRVRASGEGGFLGAAVLTSASAAFSDKHRPGFTTYPNAAILSEVYSALSTFGKPSWASAEGTNVDIYSLPFRPAAQGMESYLAGLFNHGAALVNVFGWGIGDPGNVFRQASGNSDAIAAYRRFLTGQSLTERSSLSSSLDGSLFTLQNRMRALPSLIEKYLVGGGDPGRIQPRVKQLEENMKQGRLDAMQQDLDVLEATLEGAAR